MGEIHVESLSKINQRFIGTHCFLKQSKYYHGK